MTMTGNEYQKLAMRTCSIPYERKDDRLFHAVFGLNSEAGEVAGILQKMYQGHPFDVEHIKKELGDCLWMVAETCEALGINMDDVMEMNIEKLKARYPDGFSTEKSLHRKAGDI
jgi:NTP pyrophosphatase (non-canonical NTP hydrolase)